MVPKPSVQNKKVCFINMKQGFKVKEHTFLLYKYNIILTFLELPVRSPNPKGPGEVGIKV